MTKKMEVKPLKKTREPENCGGMWFCINYLDSDGTPKTAYIKAWTKVDAVEKFNKMGERKNF